MYARSLTRPYRQLIKAAAVATLFLLGASTLRAQNTEAVRRPGLAPVNPVIGPSGPPQDGWTAVAGEVLGVILDERRKPRTRSDKARKRQAVSEWNRSVNFSGPRFGFTYLPQAVVDTLKGRGIDVGDVISQFGWQLEREIHVTADGPMVLNEWVFLAGGLEKGVFLPSASWLVGARSRSGNEVAFGPNVSLAGVGLAVAAGVTAKSGGLNFPMNVAAASSRGGIRVSFLTGFTLH